MIKYTVRRVTVEEVEVLAEDDAGAMGHAVRTTTGMEKYSFEHLGVRIVEHHMEFLKREAPPVCGVNDDGKACEEPAAHFHYKLEQRLCKRHHETMKSL